MMTASPMLRRKEGNAQSLCHTWSKKFMEAGKRLLAGDTARGDSSGLRRPREAAGDNFVRGNILYHDRITAIAERVHGAPISLL